MLTNQNPEGQGGGLQFGRIARRGRCDMTRWQAVADHLRQVVPFGISGRIRRITGLAAVVADFPAPLGAVCRIRPGDETAVDAEGIGFAADETLVLPYTDLAGVSRGVRTASGNSPQQRHHAQGGAAEGA